MWAVELMAELYIIGEVQNAVEFIEPNLFVKWSVQCGSSWKVVEGLDEGQTAINSHRFENTSIFGHPIDLHLVCRGIQGWPKIHVEVYAVNALQKYWPVGYGFGFVPTQPGSHNIVIRTWKLAPSGIIDSLRDKFHGGGFTVSKSDLIYSGIDRCKLFTQSSGIVNVELQLIFKNFTKFGIDLN